MSVVTEENIIQIIGMCFYGGLLVILFLLATTGERKAKKDRKKVIHGATNYARFQAVLVTSSQVIRRGSFFKLLNQNYPHGRG